MISKFFLCIKLNFTETASPSATRKDEQQATIAYKTLSLILREPNIKGNCMYKKTLHV